MTDYWIEAEGGGTRIRAVTSGFPMDATWDDWVEGTVRGWAYELRQLKHYLERHEGEERRALFLRRRVRLAQAEVWSRLTGAEGLADRWTTSERINFEPPVQVATILADPADAMARASVEPVFHDDAFADEEERAAAHDATTCAPWAWASAAGPGRARSAIAGGGARAGGPMVS